MCRAQLLTTRVLLPVVHLEDCALPPPGGDQHPTPAPRVKKTAATLHPALAMSAYTHASLRFCDRDCNVNERSVSTIS
eukprot:m.42331 g.42331  ORF g.42331 m.42331 type:complete len:78 (+) comp15020_c0_seq8:726-959(+)